MDAKTADPKLPVAAPGGGADPVLEKALKAARTALEIGDDTAALYWVGQYYAAQASQRAYAVMAYNIVNNVGMDGETANQQMALALGSATWSAVRASFATRLATEDYKLVSQGIVPNQRQIEEYHLEVLSSIGVSRTYFGGASFAALGASWLPDARPGEDDGTHAPGYVAMSGGQFAECAAYSVMAGSSPILKPRHWLYTAVIVGKPLKRWMSGQARLLRLGTGRIMGLAWDRLQSVIGRSRSHSD